MRCGQTSKSTASWRVATHMHSHSKKVVKRTALTLSYEDMVRHPPPPPPPPPPHESTLHTGAIGEVASASPPPARIIVTVARRQGTFIG